MTTIPMSAAALALWFIAAGPMAAASEQEMSIAKHMRLGSDLKVSLPNDSDTRDKNIWDDLMNRLTEDQRAEIRDLIEEMRADGASKEEIREAIQQLLGE